MGSALLNQTPRDEAEQATTAVGAGSHEALRHQVAERLAAHRARRSRTEGEAHRESAAPAQPADGQKTRIAAAVAERYAQAQSYRAFLAAEAERAVQQARAAAEVAATNAAAVAEAQQLLLDRLEREQRPDLSDSEILSGAPEPMLWPELEESPLRPAAETRPASAPPAKTRTSRARDRGTESTAAGEPAAAASSPETHGALRVVLYEELSRGTPQQSAAASQASQGRTARPASDDPEALALDEEISFRHAPVFEEPAGPPMALPANLIEFPRQLIASRKARPRYAEGPLREEDTTRAEGSQLRIFEVDPGQISNVPGFVEPAHEQAPQWTSLWLDTPVDPAATVKSAHVAGHPVLDAVGDALPYAGPPPRPVTAPYSRRALAASIDGAIIAFGSASFIASCAATMAHFAAPETGWGLGGLAQGAETAARGVPLAAGLAAFCGAVGVLAVAYQLLFFTFSEATPGMRLAHIGLCTFADDNPSRRAMRLRILALILSTVTLGLGHLWAVLDEDRLTWHDLISRMYPRSY